MTVVVYCYKDHVYQYYWSLFGVHILEIPEFMHRRVNGRLFSALRRMRLIALVEFN